MKRTSRLMAAVAKARHVKALSVDQIRQYLDGGDMGYSKAAEVHDFPSPAHVLKRADEVDLSAQQRAATQELLDEHKAKAREIGQRVVEAERDLEMLFRSRKVQSAALASAVRRLARAESEYRFLHLETNRRMRGLLSEEQVVRYAALRGRSAAAGAPASPEATTKGDSP